MKSAQEIGARELLGCDESFFTALLTADHELLGTILADDFLIIDVLSGQVGHREELLGAISSGQLRFAEVARHPEERWIRLRDSAAVVAGPTRMVMFYRGDEVTVHSRYTHAYARDSGRWRLMSAQGTPMSAPRIGSGPAPLFCDTALAGRIERVEAQLIAQSSEAARRRAGTEGFVIPVAGGVASFAGEDSPFNKVAGLGFGGVPDPPSSSPSRDLSPSRTRSARASTCSTPVPFWSSSPEPVHSCPRQAAKPSCQGGHSSRRLAPAAPERRKDE